jgi:hypothetical protein
MPLSNEQVVSKIFAEIEIYILNITTVESFCPLCYEIPCMYLKLSEIAQNVQT